MLSSCAAKPPEKILGARSSSLQSSNITSPPKSSKSSRYAPAPTSSGSPLSPAPSAALTATDSEPKRIMPRSGYTDTLIVCPRAATTCTDAAPSTAVSTTPGPYQRLGFPPLFPPQQLYSCITVLGKDGTV